MSDELLAAAGFVPPIVSAGDGPGGGRGRPQRLRPRALGEGPHNGNTAQLVYQDWRTDWFPAMAQQMLERFHANHPSVRVFYTPDPENLHEQMMTDFDAGTAPDVVAGCCDFLPIWAQSGHLLDLRPFVEADLDQATINDWDTAQYRFSFVNDGRQYALPKYHGALALFYNKDLFDRFELDYPDRIWNHDDYLTAMRRLTHDRGTDGRPDVWGSMLDISWDRIQMHVNGWGGHFVDPADPTRSMLGREEAIEAMDWIRDRMWDDGVMASLWTCRTSRPGTPSSRSGSPWWRMVPGRSKTSSS